VRVLAIDPGLTRCGVGVVDAGASRRVQLVQVDVLRTPPELALGLRLTSIYDAVVAYIERLQPDVMAVERVFSQHNVRTAMGTAQAAAVAILAASQAGLEVHLHTPSEVKASVTGNGRAQKDQVAIMVTKLLGLSQRPTPADATDALALAICHAWRAPAMNKIAAATR